MSMNDLMALVPIEAAMTLKTTHKGRKSRWEQSQAAPTGKSRFGPKTDRPYLPPPFVDLPPGLTPLQVDQFLREQRLDELTAKLERGELEFGDPDIRPPSPPPAYDKLGNRTNTRDVRVRNAMISEHQRLLEYMVNKVQGFIPPLDFKPVKKVRRIIIPQDKFPEYNFMGLIIGPRGCNHKRLESESGAQISIRGKGTQKEGKKTDHQTEEEASMPQHVHIAADTEESLDKAVALIEPLLNPCHPAHEEFKKKGLEQLALVNGVTLAKFGNRCSTCGAVGHMAWECPDTEFQSFQKANVKCALCGDKGHVTMDCKLAKNLSSEQLADIEKRNRPGASGEVGMITNGQGQAGEGRSAPIPPPPSVHQTRLDMEYSQMISEIGGSGADFQRSGMSPLDTFAPKFTLGSQQPMQPSSYGGNFHIPPPPGQQPLAYGSSYDVTGGFRGQRQPHRAYPAAMSGYPPDFNAAQGQFPAANQALPLSPADIASQQMQEMTALMSLMYSGSVLNPQQMERLSQLMTVLYPLMANSMAPDMMTSTSLENTDSQPNVGLQNPSLSAQSPSLAPGLIAPQVPSQAAVYPPNSDPSSFPLMHLNSTLYAMPPPECVPPPDENNPPPAPPSRNEFEAPPPPSPPPDT